jgi:outer membrane protein TolC
MQRITYMGAFFLMLFGFSPAVKAQYRMLRFEEFMTLVKGNHPLAKAAMLKSEEADAILQTARGAFDPKLGAESAKKNFGGKNYYHLTGAGLKIPTWYGMELNAAYTDNTGSFLDPEKSTPETGLIQAGLTLTAGQGLSIDRRRADLKKAGFFSQQAEAERRLFLNDLLYDAGKAYWEWFTAYHTMKAAEDAIALTAKRHSDVKSAASLGDRPPVDTLETYIQLQTRFIGLQQASMDNANGRAMLSAFLWTENGIPLEADEYTIPVSFTEVRDSMTMVVSANRDSLVTYHPAMAQYDGKIGQLKVDRRLKKEMLKPRLDLKYNALSEPLTDHPLGVYGSNNFQWGIDFSMPLFLRKERGDVRLASVKLQTAEMEMMAKSSVIGAKIQSARNEAEALLRQTGLYDQVTRDVKALLDAELRMFEGGESSVFLVNSRETAYVNARFKQIETLGKSRKAVLGVSFAEGNLGN